MNKEKILFPSNFQFTFYSKQISQSSLCKHMVSFGRFLFYLTLEKVVVKLNG